MLYPVGTQLQHSDQDQEWVTLSKKQKIPSQFLSWSLALISKLLMGARPLINSEGVSESTFSRGNKHNYRPFYYRNKTSRAATFIYFV
jgi:hypothetical protein